MRSPGCDYLSGSNGGSSYLFSQCQGDSGIEKDLARGWLVKHIFEDSHAICIIMEYK